MGGKVFLPMPIINVFPISSGMNGNGIGGLTRHSDEMFFEEKGRGGVVR